MPIPDFQTLMRPLLAILADGGDHAMNDLTKALCNEFHLNDAERVQKLPSGQQTVIGNRVAWAKAHLKMADLIKQPGRGLVQITSAGRSALEANKDRIDLKVLKAIPAYQEAVSRWKQAESDPSDAANGPNEQETPKERIDAAYRVLRDTLAEEVLDKVRAASPRFFEDLVVKLLVAMGYGGSLEDAGKRIGRGGDGGVDGIINEDRLGLDVVCIQAKRWESTVGRPIVQAFVGSLDYYRSRKGVLITTASFSKDARDYVDRIEGKKVVLIDGVTLADLMIEYNIGVSVAETYHLKRVDHDFFSEEPD